MHSWQRLTEQRITADAVEERFVDTYDHSAFVKAREVRVLHLQCQWPHAVTGNRDRTGGASAFVTGLYCAAGEGKHC